MCYYGSEIFGRDLLWFAFALAFMYLVYPRTSYPIESFSTEAILGEYSR